MRGYTASRSHQWRILTHILLIPHPLLTVLSLYLLNHPLISPSASPFLPLLHKGLLHITTLFLCSVFALFFKFTFNLWSFLCLFCRETSQDWPPIKPRLRDTLKSLRLRQRGYNTALFVKVYMEGVPIGRKLDLSTFSGYESLLENLSGMFDTSVICK